MKNNQKSFTSLILIGVIIVLVAIGGYFIWKKNHQAVSVVPQTLTQPVVATNTDKTSDWKTFSSTKYGYGFSFDYPSNWKVTEKIDTNGRPYVDLTSDIFSSDPQLSGIPEEEIQFSAVDTNYFNPPIGTKFGMIGYDSKDNLLIDTTQPSQQCLLVRPLLGIENAPLGFLYDGSQMSTPAHFNYALITQNKKIILVTEFSLGGDLSLVVNQNVSKIALSFKLLNGDSIPRVNCVSAPN
jgi:hypothetical protein